MDLCSFYYAFIVYLHIALLSLLLFVGVFDD